MAADGRGGLGLQQLPEDREIVLEIVDGVRRLRGRGPGETGAAFPRRRLLQLLRLRDAAGDGAHDVERVEARDPGARLGEFDPRIGQPQPLGRGAHGEAQQQALFARAIGLERQPRRERRAHLGIEQHRIFVRALREHPLREARHEHDAERAAPRLVRAPDEDAAVTALRRIDIEHLQAIRDDVARLVERHGTDLRHRPQLREDLQHALRPAQHHRRDRGEAVQPLPPRARRRPRRQAIDDRQRERPEMAEVAQVPLDARGLGRIGIVSPLRVPLDPHLIGEPRQPAMPAPGVAADHRRLDDQGFPLPRRAKGAFDDGVVVGGWGLEVGGGGVRASIDLRVLPQPPASILQPPYAQLIVVRHDEVGDPLRFIQPRDLRQREVFGKAPGGELLARAREDGEERAPRGMGAARAAIEPRGDAGASQRVLEQPDVTLGRAHEGGHLVERHAASGFLHDPPGDLHALAAFTRRREEPHVARRLTLGGLFPREQVPAQRDEVGVPGLLEQLPLETECLEPIHGGDVAERNRDEDRGSRVEDRSSVLGPRSSISEQRLHELEFDRRADRHVEQQKTGGKLEAGNWRLAQRASRRGEERRAIGGARVRELLVEPLEQDGEVGAAERQRFQPAGVHLREAQLLQRAGERAREPRGPGDRREVPERRVPLRVERGAGGDRFRPQVCDGREPLLREDRRREADGQLRQAESMQADRRAGLRRNRSREIVDRAARRPDKPHVTAGRMRFDKRARVLKPELCGGRFDQAGH